MGRPSTFTDDIFDQICNRLENGEVLKQICDDPEMPDRSTVLRWIANDDSKRRKYDLARQACVEFWSDEIISIATDGSKDTVIDEKGRPRCDHEWVARSRLRIDTIKFLMTKINPQRYGEKLPEAIEARRLEIEQQQQLAVAPANRVEKIILQGVSEVERDENGNLYPNSAEALRRRIAELEAQLSIDPPAEPLALMAPPAQSAHIDHAIARALVGLVKGYVSNDQQLEDVLTVCRNALHTTYGPVVEMLKSRVPA